MTKKATTAGVYCRVSTERQAIDKDKLKKLLALAKTDDERKEAKEKVEEEAKKASLEHQERRCRKHCEAQEWEVHEAYVDAGESGSKIDRPGLQAMLRDAKEGKLSNVVFLKLDRFGRDLRDLLNVSHQLDDYGVGIVSVEDAFDTSKDSGRLFFQILGAIAEFERKQIASRMMMGHKAAAEQRKFCGGVAAYGLVSKDGDLVIDPWEASIVRWIFRSCVEGKGHRDIAQELNAKSVPTKRPGGRWRQGYISTLLRSEVYIGIAYWNKTSKNGGERQEKVDDADWMPIDCPAIISAELWKQARARVGQTRRDSQRPKDKVSKFLLGGLLGCSSCGGSMFSHTKRVSKAGRVYKYAYYKCSRQHAAEVDEPCRPSELVRAEKVDAAVFAAIAKTFGDPARVLEACHAYGERAAARKDEDKGLVATLRGNIVKAERERERYEILWAQDKIDDGKRDKHFARLDSDVAGWRADLERMTAAEEQVVAVEALEASVEGIAKMVRTQAESVTLEERKSLVRALVEKVWLDSENAITIRCIVPGLLADGDYNRSCY